jgi:hypothetical protein
VPVTAEIRGVGRYHHEMAGAGCDLLKATRTDVGLVGLERVDQADLDRPVQRGIRAHSRITAITTKAATKIT